MSTIESTVTKLLVATKQLLESLTRWARGEASEQDVSDIYVNLGNEFNVACRAFLSAGIEVAYVQKNQMLMWIGANYFSDLGDVPQALRVILEKALSEDAQQDNLERYLPSIREIIVNLLRQLKEKQALLKAVQKQQQQQQQATRKQPPTSFGASSRSQSGVSYQHHGRQMSPTSVASSMKYSTSGKDSIGSSHSPSASVTSQKPMKSPELRSNNSFSRPMPESANDGSAPTSPVKSPTRTKMEPDRKDNNALAVLQRGEALERRASRRFSAYQFAKLTNGTPVVPDLPPLPGTQQVRVTTYLPTKAPHSSSRAKYTATSFGHEDEHGPGRTVAVTSETDATRSPIFDMAAGKDTSSTIEEPSSTTEFHIFLQLGRRVKKARVERSDLTINSLRLLFVDKFAYSPGSDNFPDIYIQDAQTGIRYELDEGVMEEIGAGSLLSLNLEAIDEVKKHIDEGMTSLTKHINDLHSKLEENTQSIQKISEVQVQFEGTVRDGNVKPIVLIAGAKPNENDKKAEIVFQRPPSHISMKQISDLRKDVAVVRQVSTIQLGGLRDKLVAVMKKVYTLQNAATVSNVAPSANRSYMESCNKKLSAETDKLLTSVDDIQDIVEALRKDVAQRGVRHTAKQLESVSKELNISKEELDKMEKYIINERPNWKKIWERELDMICEEQQFFKLQEELIADLQDDLKKATETFELVEECSREQVKSTGGRKNNPAITTAPVGEILYAKDAVLSEVNALQPNHESRVEAIERAEKMRKKELEMRGLGDFEDELEGFVGENKLRKSGGIEETERRRKLREQRVLEEQRKNDAEAKSLRAKEREERKSKKEKEKIKKKKSKDKRPADLEFELMDDDDLNETVAIPPDENVNPEQNGVIEK